MLPRMEFGHLYKFVVSVGLILVAAAFGLPWLILRESGPLDIEAARLDRLTPEAARIIRTKQEHYGWLLDHYVYGSAALFVTGTAVAAYGFLEWKRRQAVLDETESVHRDTVKVQLQQMTPAEVAEKAEAEAAAEAAADLAAAEPVAAEPDPAAAPRSSPAPVPPPAAPGDGKGRDRPRGTGVTLDSLRRLKAIEDEAIAALERAYASTHTVRRHVKAGRALADAVLESHDARRASVVVEIRVARDLNVFNRLGDAPLHAAQLVADFRRALPGPVVALLLLLVDPSLDEDRRNRLTDAAARSKAVLAEPVGIVVLGRDELARMPPGELRRLVDRAW